MIQSGVIAYKFDKREFDFRINVKHALNVAAFSVRVTFWFNSCIHLNHHSLAAD